MPYMESKIQIKLEKVMNKKDFMEEDGYITTWKENKEKAFKADQTALTERQKGKK